MAKPAPLAMRNNAHTVPQFQQTQDHGAPPTKDLGSVEAAATRAGVCFHFRYPNHVVWNCRMQQQFRNPSMPPFPPRPYNRYPAPQNVPQQAGFQPFYPIIAPMGSTGTYPQVHPPSRPPHQATPQDRATPAARSTVCNESTRNGTDKSQSSGPLKQARGWRRLLSRDQVKGEDQGLWSWAI
ncbi:hypothetical protein PTTG_28783 [Puccinia triticina 1-1 BBBD Race 1]|uniref:Uncharacterized protein n=1 Tax=Puccinia triticina (isolate 1-1 / race 1 (BBBD)) TaxID=630390 RepID=A0A180G9J7_PUCT1|nr:hypothetical protein PTTG_28783 [Puccinia triticina 1-1 BBBD Race 1]